jgi:hypothetical protein
MRPGSVAPDPPDGSLGDGTELMKNLTPVHETELCAWWVQPYCERPASKRDLCLVHYSKAHKLNDLPPMIRRRPARAHSIDRSRPIPECLTCGPVTHLLGGVRCPFSQREYVLREKYGLTLADYDERLIALGNRCGMCGQPPGLAGLVVDHSHESGHPRDLICMSCNVLLGHVEKGLDRVKLALAYIEMHRSRGALG